MPPYKPIVSKSQGRALAAKARRGELSMDEARGKIRAADYSSLPERLSGKKRGKRMARRTSVRAARRY